MGNAANNAEGLFGFGPNGNNARRKRGMTAALAAGNEAKDVLTPPTLPPPPSALEGQITAAQAMTQAANRYRKQFGGGLSSTIRTGAAGDTSIAPTNRRTLFGI